jgi:predicted Holliday junction resolvase-like endonuclease
METSISITLVIAALFFVGVLFKLYIRYQRLERAIEQERLSFENRLKEAVSESKKRSSAVQWGLSIENFVPFTTDFPIPPEDVNFLGKPIDYIGFTNTDKKDECIVHFIEVKSGKSLLSNKQKNIRDAVMKGRVMWHELRVDPNKLKE